MLLTPAAPRLRSAFAAPVHRPASGTRLYRPLNQLVGLGHDAHAPAATVTDPAHPRLIGDGLQLPEHDVGEISRFPPRSRLAGLGPSTGLGGLERSAFAAAAEDGFGGAGAQPVAPHSLLVAARQTEDSDPSSTVKVLKVVTPISFNLHDADEIDLHPRRQLLLALLPLFGLFIWMDGAKGVWGGGGAVVEGEASAGHNLITYHSMQNSTTPKNGLPCGRTTMLVISRLRSIPKSTQYSGPTYSLESVSNCQYLLIRKGKSLTICYMFTAGIPPTGMAGYAAQNLLLLQPPYPPEVGILPAIPVCAIPVVYVFFFFLIYNIYMYKITGSWREIDFNSTKMPTKTLVVRVNIYISIS